MKNNIAEQTSPQDAPDEYPEHERLKSISDKSQAIGEFLEWLTDEQGFVLCRYEGSDGNRPWPQHVNIQDLLAKHFEIDQDKIENEKEAMLEKCRIWQRQEVSNG